MAWAEAFTAWLKAALARPEGPRRPKGRVEDDAMGVFPAKLDSQSEAAKERRLRWLFGYGFFAAMSAVVVLGWAVKTLAEKQRVVPPPLIVRLDPFSGQVTTVEPLDRTMQGIDLLTMQYIDEYLQDRYEITPIDLVMAKQWERGKRIKVRGLEKISGGSRIFNRSSEYVFDEFARIANKTYEGWPKSRSRRLDRGEMAQHPPENLGSDYWRRQFTIIEEENEREVNRIKMVATMKINYITRIVESLDAKVNPAGFVVEIYSATGRN